MIEYERTDISEGIDVKQIYQKNVIFATIGISKISVLNMSLTFVMDVMI